MLKRLTFFLIILSLTLDVSLGGFQRAKLSQKQVTQLVAIGTPDEVIAQEIQRRGLDFEPTQKMMDDLVNRGAGPQMISALRESSSLTSQHRPSSIGDVLYISSHQGLGLLKLNIANHAARQVAKTVLVNNALIAWNPQLSELYVAATNGDAVSVVSDEPFSESATLKGDVGWNTFSMALSRDGKKLYLGCLGHIVSFDTTTRSHLKTSVLGDRPAFVALSPDDASLYVSWGDHLDRFEPQTLRLLQREEFYGLDSSPLVVSGDKQFLFIAQSGRLIRWNTHAWKADGEIVLPEGGGPQGEISLTRDGNAVLVSGQKAIYRVPTSMQGYSSIRPPAPARDRPFAFAESSDGRVLYVLSGYDGDENLWAIDTVTQRVLQTFTAIPFPLQVLTVGNTR